MGHKARRNEPNHPPADPPKRGAKPAATTSHPTDCTQCEGTGRTRTARQEGDEDGGFDGAEVVNCSNCGGSGKENR